jgi:hypothetical protein
MNCIPVLKVVDIISRPLVLYCDNEPVVFYTTNNKSSASAKHININYYVVKYRIQDRTIDVKYISTNHMLIDPLMKGLPSSIFHEHVARMGLLEAL